ncbi:MAG: hypothetical protein HY001_03375, partial [Candidatus Portnoybacteria bacterium]|nr:hypothetical protein [Candidatus Portnoybacteria bacterium]
MKEVISSEARNKVLSEAKVLIRKLTPKVVLDVYYYIGEFFAALFYGFCGLRLKVIGVTGTKGKSSTVYLITRILEEAGFRVAASSSIEMRFNHESKPSQAHMTMPSRFHLQRFLQEAKRRECDFIVLEVTSEGLAQHRGDFIHFQIALLTNLTPEHIESHGSYENYKEAKRRLFELLDKRGIAIVNEDDKEARYFLSTHKGKNIVYSVKKSPKPLDIRLIGEFNQYNALAAYTACRVIGVKESLIKEVLRSITYIPGRLEEISEGQPFRVFVDYAYNTSSLQTVLQTLLPMKQKNASIVTLTGSAGGGRDRWRRAVMGKIAAQYSDKVIITSE